MSRGNDQPPVIFAGHPFANIGKGDEMRSAFSSYRFLDPRCRIFDVYRHAKRLDRDHISLCRGSESRDLDAPVRVFHINGDEVAPVLTQLENRGLDFSAGRNVVVPAWELPRYPAEWADELEHFDEVWAISRFVQESLAAAGVASVHVGQAVEMPARPYLPRRHFAIRSSSFVFLTLLDLSSYSTRKNPEAALEMFHQLRQRHPFADMQLVVKVKSGDDDAKEWVAEALGNASPDVVFIDWLLDTHETQSLIAACDCVVSLHRSEGFGRAAAEAMWLGRAVIATGWSGNLDYMNRSYPGWVGYELTDVLEGQYPFHAGQVWAEPDVDDAVRIADQMVTDAVFTRAAAAQGQEAVRRDCSFRAVGLRMLDRVNAMLEEA
ncbi:glycosyltransferase [Nioella halotolerans]|uniref:glycosyltransferase n=1 Tax=Nioella halotolerans TaxID=2303578 RepID=UPI0026D902DD